VSTIIVRKYKTRAVRLMQRNVMLTIVKKLMRCWMSGGAVTKIVVSKTKLDGATIDAAISNTTQNSSHVTFRVSIKVCI
jgi:hypothetical protein